MTASPPPPARRSRADSAVPPIGDGVDLHALPLTALIARLSHLIVRELAGVYVEEGITAQPLDASLLILLAKGGARLTAIAERLNTSKQALSFVVDRLDRDGYLIRITDPMDKRAKLIELTATGRRAAQVSDSALRHLERRWRSKTGDDWPHLRAALADIASTGD